MPLSLQSLFHGRQGSLRLATTAARMETVLRSL